MFCLTTKVLSFLNLFDLSVFVQIILSDTPKLGLVYLDVLLKVQTLSTLGEFGFYLA